MTSGSCWISGGSGGVTGLSEGTDGCPVLFFGRAFFGGAFLGAVFLAALSGSASCAETGLSSCGSPVSWLAGEVGWFVSGCSSSILQPEEKSVALK